jgi:hypothetical protein
MILECSSFSQSFSPNLLCSTTPWSTRPPPVVLAVVLWFCRCMLRPERSPVTGAWSSRARGFPLRGPRVLATFQLFCRIWWRSGLMVSGCCKGSSGAGACSTRAVSGGAPSDVSFWFWVFSPVLNLSLYLAIAMCLI